MRNGGTCTENRHQVGFLPKKGWKRRNLHFLGRSVLPQIFAKRTGRIVVPDFPDLRHGEVSLTWTGHASFLLQVGSTNILIDPNWAMWLGVFKRVRYPGISLLDLPEIDLVLISHAHHDHLHLPTLRQIAAGQPVLVPKGVGAIVRRLGFGEVVEMDYWERWNLGETEVTFTPAQHWGARFVHDTHRKFGGFFVQQGEGSGVYHAGDSAMFDGFQEIGERCSIQTALLPIGAYGAPSGRDVHMNPEEAVEAFGQLGADRLVPMHYGTFPLGSEPMDEPIERLLDAARSDGVADRIEVLEEGVPLKV